MLDIESYLLGKKAGGGGGGGNPNEVHTFTGTLADIFTNMTEDERHLFTDLSIMNWDKNAVIQIDATALGMGQYNQTLTSDTIIFETSGADISSYNSIANNIWWESNGGDLMSAYIEQNGTITDLSSYASMVGVTITYCYHPMPT